MHNPYLIGERVYLRPFEPADALHLTAWMNDPEVLATVMRYRPVSQAQQEAFLAKVHDDEQGVGLAVVRRDGDRLLGTIGLKPIEWRNRHAGFGLVLGDKAEWGKGYATEATRLMVGYAFETLNLNRVWLHVHENNPAGIRAYEKVGFKTEGVLRQDLFKAGRYWDTRFMGILREEWGAKQG